MKLADLNVNVLYTYADYLRWQIEERVELIKGKIFAMSAPSRAHQKISSFLHGELYAFLKGRKCEVYSAPFDVRIPRKSKDDKDIVTVVQPDICVVCNPAILDARGCIGAPDVVVEILSPGNNVVELRNKYELYEESGVLEYWVVSPDNRTFLCYTLVDGKFSPSRLLVDGDVFHSSVLEGFTIDCADMFGRLEA